MTSKVFCDICDFEMTPEEVLVGEHDDWGSREPQVKVVIAGYPIKTWQHVCTSCRVLLHSYLENNRSSLGKDC